MTFLLISFVVAVWAVLMVGLFVAMERLRYLRIEGTHALAELITMLDRHDRMAGERARHIAARFNPALRELENTSPYTGPDRRSLDAHFDNNAAIFNGTALDNTRSER